MKKYLIVSVFVLILGILFFGLFIDPTKASSDITVGTYPISSTTVGTKLYVNNENSNNVSVIDTTTDTVLTTISVGTHPQSSTTVGTKLYVNNYDSNNVSVINTTTDTVLTTIFVGTHPQSSTAVGTKLYVNNADSTNVSVINTTTDTVLTTISVGGNPISSTTVGTKLYVNNQFSSNVSVIDTTTNTVLTTISVGSYPQSSTIVGTKLYVNNYGSNNVSVIDTTTDTFLTTIPVGTSPYSSTLVGTKLYVNNQSSNNVSVIDTTTNTVLKTIPVGSSPYSSIAVGTKLYVNNSNSRNVLVIDTTTNTVLTTISVGTAPISSTIVGTKLYVNNRDSNNVSVIDTTLVAPIFSGAEALEIKLTIMYTYALDSNSIPATSDFAVKVNGNTVGISALNITDKRVLLTLASTPALTDTVTVSYTKGSNPIQDIVGDASLDLTNEAVIVLNNSFVGTQTLYGADGAGENSDTKLYILDPDSGDVIGEPIGLTGHNINGMDFNPTTGILYGNTNNDPDGSKPKSLFTINTTTGLATWLGTIKDSGNNTLSFPDITFKSDGTLYGFANNNGSDPGLTHLYIIDTTCPDQICHATQVDSIPLGSWTSGGGLAFDSQDNLYLFRDEDNGFQKLKPDTGEVLSHTDYANPSGWDYNFLAAKFDGNDNLIASRSNFGGSPSDLVRIDLENGMITSTGEDNPVMTYMTALAFYLEPLESLEPASSTVRHTSSGSCLPGFPCSVNSPLITEPIVETPTTTPEQILGSGKCLSTLIITDNLKQGDRNGKYSTYNKGIVKQVDILQAHINRILATSYKQAAGPVDGIFGPLTKQGVMRLQINLNTILKPIPLLKIDGIVGPFTKGAINNSCGK